ncbi:MAG: orotate phosphoribosyltransferase [Candidatus Aenigmarchaeota archaeon]|nr:orotate phosphoribosyltransferase [Candidatus Aenigmarchaeota archaeon]
MCDLCGRPSKVHTCVICGARVCETHYSWKGLCTKCYEARRGGRVARP